jgi:molecular chaperone GrpE
VSPRDSEPNEKNDQPEIAGASRPALEAGRSQTGPEAPGAIEAARAAAGAGKPSEEGAPSALAEQVRKLQAEKQDLMDTLVRRQADFENYRKRVEKERHADRHRGVEVLVEHLLPVLDAFDRALAGHDDSASAEYRKGFELIRRQLWDALSKQGLKRIDAVGKEFDPHLHHAIERVETPEHADGTVVGELQPGYMFHDRVLRPAMVRVAAEPVSKRAHDN